MPCTPNEKRKNRVYTSFRTSILPVTASEMRVWRYPLRSSISLLCGYQFISMPIRWLKAIRSVNASGKIAVSCWLTGLVVMGPMMVSSFSPFWCLCPEYPVVSPLFLRPYLTHLHEGETRQVVRYQAGVSPNGENYAFIYQTHVKKNIFDFFFHKHVNILANGVGSIHYTT